VSQSGAGEDILLNPADAYVAEFVKHMNPLKVLSCGAVMKSALDLVRSDSGILLDRAGLIRVELDGEDRPLSVTVSGRSAPVHIYRGDAVPDLSPDSVLVVPVDIKLKAAVALKRQTDHPILLVDQLGRLAGLCGDEEIYASLLRR
jgi:glycine betaine/proline transport system ATP-binding protein